MTRHAVSLLLCLTTLWTAACSQNVNRVPHATISRLHRNSIPPDPKDFPKGELKISLSWRLRPGLILQMPMVTDLGIPGVEGRINGTDVPLILDSGNSFPILLDANSALELALPTIRGARAKGTGVGGTVDVLMARFESLELANQQTLGRGISGVFLHSYRTTFAGMALSETPLNLLGLPLLERFSFVTLDAPANQVRLGYKTPYQPRPGAAFFPFTISEGRMWVVLKIGGKEVKAFFDSGCGSGLRLPGAELEKIPESARNSASLRKRKAMGVGGVEMEMVGQFKEAQLGHVRMQPLEFDTSPSASEALLGWGPFRKHKLTMDFVQRRVWVEPPPESRG